MSTNNNNTAYLDHLRYPNTLFCSGSWTVSGIKPLLSKWRAALANMGQQVKIDGSGIEQFDSAGALLLHELTETLQAQGKQVQTLGFASWHQRLLDLAESVEITEAKPKAREPLLTLIGRRSVAKCRHISQFLSFVGELTVICNRIVRGRAAFPLKACLSVFETAGFNALPILTLLAFLVGVVLTYQMGIELREYGANIYIVNVLGLAFLREFGPLITAIIIAGRTGSAFAAQIGTMKINEEVAALKTMGLSPLSQLVLPKVIALLLILPLLTFWSDLFGVLGGMVMAKSVLQVSYYEFIDRFAEVIQLKTYFIGLVKAPVFALIIATVGCFQGLQVEGKATSIGKRTTRSVVQAIFLIIIADAAFSVFFSWQGI